MTLQQRIIGVYSYVLIVAWGSVHAQVVDIPDPNLRSAVREALQLPHGEPITRESMLQLTQLDVISRDIADLMGLEFAKHLRWLSIAYNPITDLSPIAGLNKLEVLYMWATPVSDITPVANLTNLRKFGPSYCDIADISPIANLLKLDTLALDGNEIADITPLANLTRLENLNLSANNIVDVSPLANLTQLHTLSLQGNLITDHSPLDGLSLDHFTHDLETPCDMPPLPLAPRIENRNFPSLITGWSDISTWSSYDLIFCCPPFDTAHRDTAKGFQIRTHHSSWDGPLSVRDAYLQKNPTMVFLTGISVIWNILDRFPEDSPFWLRDENGEIMPAWDMGLMNLNHPGWQQWVIDRAVAIDRCGLYDGIFIDGWAEYATKRNGTFPGQIAILKGIRERVRDNFLIMVNTNAHESPASAEYINGLFMETVFPYHERRPDVLERRLTKIENTLKWAESTVREPRINALEGRHDYNEPLDSPRNTQWMRAITTLSLTFSNGYSVFPNQKGKHWYNSSDADLGRPVGNTLQLYEDRPGLYIREFTNERLGCLQPQRFSAARDAARRSPIGGNRL